MKKFNMKKILSLLMAVVMTVGLLWPGAVVKAAAPEIELVLSDNQQAKKTLSFKCELPAEYQVNWTQYCFEAYLDGSDTPELMWVDYDSSALWIWADNNGNYNSHQFASGVGMTTSLYIPAGTTLSQSTYGGSHGQINVVSGGKTLTLKNDFSIKVVDGVWVQQVTGLTGETPIEMVSTSYSDSESVYTVNVKATDNRALNTISNVNGTALVNGVSTAVTWTSDSTNTYYQLRIPYSAVWLSTVNTNAGKNGCCYVVIKAGTTIGNVTVSEDFNLKVYGGKATSGTYHIEQVDSVPAFFYSNWNYNGTHLVFCFRNTIGTAAGNTIYDLPMTVEVDGVKCTHKAGSNTKLVLNGNGQWNELYVPFSHFGGATSVGTLGTHILKVSAGTYNYLTLDKDVYIKVTNSSIEELVPTTVDLGPTSSFQDTNQRYIIRLVPRDGRAILNQPGASTMSVLVDGVKKDSAIHLWDCGEDNYGACINYGEIESGVDTAAQMGKHTITFPAGTYVGNMMLKQDFVVEIDGQTVQKAPELAPAFRMVSSGYSDSNSIYTVNVAMTDNRVLTPISDVSGTVLVNGVETAVTWGMDSTNTYYQLKLPYTAVWHSGQTTNASKGGSCFVVVKAGTTIGDITLTEDFNVKVHGGKATSGSYLIEQVDEVPAFFYSNWNYNSTTLVFCFRNTSGVAGSTYASTDDQIFVDGISCWNKWDGNGQWNEFKLQFTQFGKTDMSSLDTHIVRFPAGSIGGNTWTEDIYLKMTSSSIEELFPTTVELEETSGYQDDNQRYVIRLTPTIGKQILDNAGSSTTTILVDGVEVTDAISGWECGNDYYGAYIDYSKIKSDVNTAAQMGKHTITFPEGSYVGNVMLSEDFVVTIDGQNISTSVGETNSEVGLVLTEAGYQDGNAGNYRYVFWLKADDGRATVDIGDATTRILVDGEEVTSGVSWADKSEIAGYALAVNYSAIQSDANVSTDVEKHLITIPVGTVVGDIVTTKELVISVNGRSIYVPTTATVSEPGYQDGNKRFIFWLKPDDGRAIVDLGSPINKVLIDGKEVTSGLSWLKGGATYGLCVSYDALSLGATSYSQIGEHIIVIQAGTVVGNMELAEDIYIKVNNGTINTKITTVNLKHVNTSIQTNSYQIWFEVVGATSNLSNITDGTVYIDGKKVTGIDFTASNDADGKYYAVSIPFDKVQSGATSWEDVTMPHILSLPVNTILSGMILEKAAECSIIGGTVTQVLEPTVTVTLNTHLNNATSGAGKLWFTVSPEDALPHNTDGSVVYHFIKDGVTVDGAGRHDAEATKVGPTVYYVDLSAYDVETDDIVSIKGVIQGDDYAVEYTETFFQYKESTGWRIYIPPTNTDVYLEYTSENGAENMTGIYMNATSDPLPSGNYYAQDFIWDQEGDGIDQMERHGGIHLNDVEITDDVVLQKKYDGRYYLDLSSVIGNVKNGDIIRLEGTLFVDHNYVAFHEISFRRNPDGSFTQYDASVPAIPAQNVNLGNLYINVDKQASYTIPSTPLVKNAGVVVNVNGKYTEEFTLTKAGIYQVERIMENIILESKISTAGDIIYNQNIYMFKTGDANLSTEVSAADVLNLKKNQGKTSDVIGGANDLNYNDKIDATDYSLLVDYILGKMSAEDIYTADEDSVVIGAISDMHYLANATDAQNRISTRKALNYYKSQNADVIFFTGDISDLGEVKSYQKLVADITSVYPDEATRPKMIFTGDNHEWYDAWTVNGHTPTATFAQTQERFCEQLKTLREGNMDDNTYYKVNGYHFIGISSDGMPEGSGQCNYTAETIQFAKEKLDLAYADSTTKPIFLAIHQAPPDTVEGSDGADCFDSADMEALLKNYPNLVVITGHTHTALQDERSIHQGDYTTLNDAALDYVGGESGKTNVNEFGTVSTHEFGQGLLLRADGRDVVVERHDFYNNNKVKEDWTFTAGVNTKYTSSRANSSVAPKFAAGSTISASWVDDTSATITFNAATHDDFVSYYIVKVYKGTSTTPSSYNYSNYYFLGLDKLEDTVTFTINKLNAEYNYRFEVQAVETFGKTSTAISGSLGAK